MDKHRFWGRSLPIWEIDREFEGNPTVSRTSFGDRSGSTETLQVYEAVGKLREDDRLESKCYMMRGKNYFGAYFRCWKLLDISYREIRIG
jgi:hypothetical protein